MTDQPNTPDIRADDDLIARMRGALDEAARIEPGTAKPSPAPDRRRWLAVAAAAVLVIGGVAALAVNLSNDHAAVADPVPATGTLLTGQAAIIDMGDGPRMAVTLDESLPPQGGDIPLTGFDWSMVDDEQSLNGTTWTTWLQVTGTWDGTAFTVTRPPTDATPDDSPGLGAPTAGCPRQTTDSAASALGELDTTALHLSFWAPDPFGGRCGASAVAWFDTQEVRDAIDSVRAEGHEIRLTFVFNPVPAGTTDPTTTTGVRSGDGWYEIAAPGLTARPPEFTVCCPPMPAPGPDVVMAWTDGSGGLLMLQAIGHVDGSSPELKFAHYGMSDDRAKELEAKVVPGSGLPYVLDDPNMELLGQGFDGIGTSVSQRYIPNAGDGDVVLTVGDYTGQLAALAGPFPVEQTTIAGQPGVRYATNSSVVFVWQTPDTTSWAQLSISSALASRADEIVASLTPAPLPIDSTTSTTVDTKPTNTITAPVDDVVYMGNVGGIIDSGDGRGPMLTFFWLDSYPPQGGTLPLDNFDWSMVDGEQTANGTTWLDETIGVTGTFDGTTFTLTEPPSSPFTFTDDVLTYGTLTEGCTEADVAPALAALNAIDHVALGLIESSDYRWDGHCGVQLAAMFDSEGLRNAIATLGDDVMVRIAFHPVQP